MNFTSPFGQELILDIHDCTLLPQSREKIASFMRELCLEIGMEAEDLHFWDYHGDQAGYDAAPPHLKGTSAVQFIMTSTITLHTLDDLKKVYLNVFSCKDFDHDDATVLAARWFGGTPVRIHSRVRA
jgi:S-adenosylmethionine/arginine decarboxylase-like enzyme